MKEGPQHVFGRRGIVLHSFPTLTIYLRRDLRVIEHETRVKISMVGFASFVFSVLIAQRYKGLAIAVKSYNCLAICCVASLKTATAGTADWWQQQGL